VRNTVPFSTFIVDNVEFGDEPKFEVSLLGLLTEDLLSDVVFFVASDSKVGFEQMVVSVPRVQEDHEELSLRLGNTICDSQELPDDFTWYADHGPAEALSFLVQ